MTGSIVVTVICFAYWLFYLLSDWGTVWFWVTIKNHDKIIDSVFVGKFGFTKKQARKRLLKALSLKYPNWTFIIDAGGRM